MSYRSSWRRQARVAIELGVEEAAASGLSGAAVERFVRRVCYPFGERKRWPYKVWCSELRVFFRGARLFHRRRRRAARSTADVQMDLFR
jgi:hypothetical protein